MSVKVESGDIILIKSDFNTSTNKDEKYRFGHVEIGVCDPDFPDQVSVWPLGMQLSNNLNRASMAHVYRAAAPKEQREAIYLAIMRMRGNLGSDGATDTPVFRNAVVLSYFGRVNASYDERLLKYWNRLQDYNLTGPIVRKVFCSESAVLGTQLAAMIIEADKLPRNTSADTVLRNAKENPLFIPLSAINTLPDDLYKFLKGSPNWRFVGDYTHNPDSRFDTPLAAAVRVGLSHYKRRPSLFSNKSRESEIALINLKLLTSPPGVDECGDEELRWYLQQILGIFPFGHRVKPMSKETSDLLRVIKLKSASRLRTCLIASLKQMNEVQFVFP